MLAEAAIHLLLAASSDPQSPTHPQLRADG